ncbi:MAG: hypothetical protein B7733_08680 [Myxococcales bacterium FL481]|nr:MAG: hypothetical protein B7733_08680 [Myxococcales bacterium FL481]
MTSRKISTVLFGALATFTLLGSVAPLAQADQPAAPDSKDGYELKVDKPASVKAGQEATFTVNLKSKGPWHINQEFPTKVQLKEVAGVTFPKKKLTKADAAKFSEKEAEFKVPFNVAAKGAKTIESELVFSVCIESQCSRVKEKVKVAVTAK